MGSPEDKISSPENKTSLAKSEINLTEEEKAVEIAKLKLEVKEIEWRLRRVYRYAQLVSVFVAVVVAVGAIATFWWNAHEFNAQQAMTFQREVMAHEREFRKPVWDRQLGLYYELTELTATIADPDENDENRKKAAKRFKVLYRGPSVFVEGRAQDPEHRPQSEFLSVDDIVDPVGLAKKIRDASDSLSNYIKANLSSKLREQLDNDENTVQFWLSDLRKDLTDNLNRILREPTLSDYFDPANLSAEALNLKAQKPKDRDLIRLNRLILEEAYPEIRLDLKPDLIAFQQCLNAESVECQDKRTRATELNRLSIAIAYKCRAKIGSTWGIRFSDDRTETTVPLP